MTSDENGGSVVNRVRLDKREWKWLVAAALGPAITVMLALFGFFMQYRREVDVMNVRQQQLIKIQAEVVAKQQISNDNSTSIAVILSKLQTLDDGQDTIEESIKDLRRQIQK